MTTLLHKFIDNIADDDKLQDTDLEHLLSSETTMRSLAENLMC